MNNPKPWSGWCCQSTQPVGSQKGLTDLLFFQLLPLHPEWFVPGHRNGVLGLFSSQVLHALCHVMGKANCLLFLLVTSLRLSMASAASQQWKLWLILLSGPAWHVLSNRKSELASCSFDSPPRLSLALKMFFLLIK